MKTKIFAIVVVLAFVSCDDFLDINTDPNNPTEARLNQILPYTQATLFGAMGFGTAGISELTAVYAHHTVQRGNHDDYKIPANEFSLSESWEKSYTVILPDLNQLIVQGTAENRPAYVGIAKIMKAQMFSLMVDLWGDIPYTEAGNPVDFKFPHFDSGHDIYAQLFTLIDEGIADLSGATVTPATDDLVYGGDLSKWIRYANSLKLNMYNKVRLTDLYNASEVAELLAGPLMAAPGDDFQLLYRNSISPDNRNPAFIREYAQSDPQYYISPYFYLLMKGDQACQNSLMTGIEDPRIPYYFYNQLNDSETPQSMPSYLNGNFLSIWFGSFDRDPNEGFGQNTSQTVIGLYPAGGAYDDGSGTTATNNSGLRGASAQRILTSAAVDYIRAELALTQGTTDNPRVMLESAMNKSFAKVNAIAATASAPLIPAEDISAYISAVLARYDAADNDGKLEIIMTQKWIQEFGFAVDAYSDIRRTGYPQVCDPAQDLNEFSIQTNPYPVSLPYNGNDLTNNGNAPAQRNQYTDRIFWDQN